MPGDAPLRRPRFYRRKRFWAWSGGSIALAVVLALFAVYWLLSTVAGRDVLLAQIVARLPAGSTLTWSRAEGPVSGPLTLHDLDFRYGDIHFTAQRAYLEPDLRPLLGKRLRLDALELTNATLDMKKSDEPFTLPRWPDSLPQVEMPIAIQADRIAIDGLRITQSGEPLVDVRRLHGGIDIANGELHAESLAIDTDYGRFNVDGDYAPGDGYRTDLTVGALLPAVTGKTQARFGLVARGDLDAMDIAVAGNAPAPLRASLALRGAEVPNWTFAADSTALDLAALGTGVAGEPVAFAFRANGTGGRADLSGNVSQGAYKATIAPSKVQVEDQVLVVEPLVIDALEGRTTLRGRADFNDPANARLRFAVHARGLRYGGADGAPAVQADADLGLAGTLKQWATYGAARLERDGQAADLHFDLRGDDTKATIASLRATMPTGELAATGQVGWAPKLAWDVDAKLAGFDPGYFAPGWTGKVSGALASTGGARDGGGYDANVDITSLGGQLRGRPLAGHGTLELRGDDGRGDVDLQLGESRVQASGTVGDRIDIDATLQPLLLADLLPGAAGRIAGRMQLSGTRDAPTIDADLQGSGVRWTTYAADTVSLQGRLPWRDGSGQLALRASGLAAGVALDRLQVDATGAIENLRLSATANNAMASAALSGTAVRTSTKAGTAHWAGSLDTLRLVPARGASWQLRAPARYAQSGADWTLSDACLAGSAGGAVCASANWPRDGLAFHGDALPLSLVDPWLPPTSGRPMVLNGEIAFDGKLRPSGNAFIGEVNLLSSEGGLKLGADARRDVVRYDNLSLHAELTPQRIQAKFGTGLRGDGWIDADFTTGWEANAPLQGQIVMGNSDLVWLELFSPDLVNPKGQLDVRVQVAGTRSAPSLGGQATLKDFTGELPALGLDLKNGQARFDALPDGTAKIAGTVVSGEGTLTVDGSLGWDGRDTPLLLNLRGTNVLVADTTEMRAVANPNLQLSIAGNTIAVRGDVTVPSAQLDLEKLDQGVSVSPDVVVLDPVDPTDTGDSLLDLDFALVLGDAVKLRGFGLEGSLAGQMRVLGKPGREMRATGRLDAEGRYTAYGQKLQITRGELSWSNSIVSDPVINLRAERVVGDVTAGVDVTGRASRPRAQIWSDPSMEESEALAYLALGRSLSTATAGESEQITAASAALSAGSSLLASQLVAKLGFDDAGVVQSRALGASVFGVGKFLSPKVYVGYGVSLVGAGQVLTLKYLLRKGFDIEIESSTVENRASINWRKEK